MFRKGFTLIELLIVVLIIAILAAIAIPNFMEFQTRAKVSRAKADMRTIATGLEAYCVDEGTYPANEFNNTLMRDLGLNRLTTPIAYLTSIPHDPFGDREVFGSKVENYEYGSGKAGQYASGQSGYPNDIWILESSGPDNQETTLAPYGTISFPWVGTGETVNEVSGMIGMIYDPTNGTVSRGQIFRTGGTSPPERTVKLFFNLVKR